MSAIIILYVLFCIFFLMRGLSEGLDIIELFIILSVAPAIYTSGIVFVIWLIVSIGKAVS